MRTKSAADLYAGMAAIIVLHMPFFILGEGAHLRIHDNLDSEFVYLHVLKMTGNLFGLDGTTPIYNIFNGLGRGSFHSEFSFVRVLFYILPSFWAYVVNSILIRAIGFAGVYLLARDYFPSQGKRIITFIIALTFALIPLYTLYGLSIMGQPLLLWAFLNLLNKQKTVLSFVIIGLFPFYSHLAFSAPFILPALLLYGLYSHVWGGKKITGFFLTGMGVLLLMSVVANVTMITGLFGGEPLHREDWIATKHSLASMLQTAATTVLFGQYHSAAINSIPLLLLLACALWKKAPQRYPALALFGTVVAIATFAAFYDWIFGPLFKYFHILISFQFDRTTVLIPLLLTVILLLLNQIEFLPGKVFYSILIVFTLLQVYKNVEISYNWIKLAKEDYRQKDFPAFRTFYSTDLFAQIDHYINRPKDSYRVVSVGLQPSIAQYNGFYTLDSYQNHYPLAYKRKFRKIIEGELNKDAKLKNYFDNWGSRCFIFSAELSRKCDYDCRKDFGAGIQNLAINTRALKDMGGEYIFSAVEILNAASLNIHEERVFEDKVSNYKIYLYKR